MTKTGLEFRILVIVICPSTWLRVVSPSTLLRTVSLSNGLSNHLIFVICALEFLVILAAATTGIFYSFANTNRYSSRITPTVMAESATLKAGQW